MDWPFMITVLFVVFTIWTPIGLFCEMRLSVLAGLLMMGAAIVIIWFERSTREDS